MPCKEVGAKAVEFWEGEFRAHGFLNADNVNVFISHVLNELAVAAIMAEAADVPEEGTHYTSIEGLLNPRTRDALWARRAAVRERVRPRSSMVVKGGIPPTLRGGGGIRSADVVDGPGGEYRAALAAASLPSRISRALMASIWAKGGQPLP